MSKWIICILIALPSSLLHIISKIGANTCDVPVAAFWVSFCSPFGFPCRYIRAAGWEPSRDVRFPVGEFSGLDCPGCAWVIHGLYIFLCVVVWPRGWVVVLGSVGRGSPHTAFSGPGSLRSAMSFRELLLGRWVAAGRLLGLLLCSWFGPTRFCGLHARGFHGVGRLRPCATLYDG